MDYFRSPEFASHVEDLMHQHHVPGLALAVVQDDEILSAGYGKASLEPSDTCTADTLFDIASCSKSFTAASIALLVDDDERFPDVRYDALMSDLLPEDFVMPGTEHKGVTVDDVLSHRTGMASHDDSYLGIRATTPDDARSVTRNLRNLPVAAPVRTRYIYNNLMYTVATHLVEVISQQSFATFLDEKFFQPLDMRYTNLQPTLAREKGLENRLSAGYCWKEETSTYREIPIQTCPEAQGAGSIITSANDLIKWVRALINLEHPINKSVYQGLVRLRSFQNPNGKDLKPYTSPIIYAAGLEVYYYRGHTVIGHDGAVPGWASTFFFLPDHKFGAVIMGNSEGVHAICTILTKRFIDTVLCVSKQETFQSGRTENNPEPGPSRSEPEHGQKTANESKNMSSLPIQEHDLDPQQPRLTAYTGAYINSGYHTFVVQIKENLLFIDACDRSVGFTLTFKPVQDQQGHFLAHLSCLLDGWDAQLEAEFEFRGGKAVRMGLKLDNDIEGLIWFDKVVQDDG